MQKLWRRGWNGIHAQITFASRENGKRAPHRLLAIDQYNGRQICSRQTILSLQSRPQFRDFLEGERLRAESHALDLVSRIDSWKRALQIRCVQQWTVVKNAHRCPQNPLAQDFAVIYSERSKQVVEV